MVDIRLKERSDLLSFSQRRILKWVLLFVGGGSFVIIILNSHRIIKITTTTSTTSNARGTILTKISLESTVILPQPDGTKDYNLKKKEDATTTTFNAFSFYLMGDTPYRDWQESRLGIQMSEMKKYVKTHPERNLSFTVHVGDIQKIANTQCEESSYKNISTLLRKGPLPTIVVPGDNDWYDCPNRTESFNFFLQYFGTLETKWHKNDYKPLGIERSSENQELFVFYREGILFIGIHLINAPLDHEDIDSWNARMKMNKEWVAYNIESHFEKLEIRGVIILGHALRSPRTRPFFLSVADYFVNITHRQDLPVVYLHGDGHDWDVDTKLSHQLHWKHFRDIQVDQGGLADPVIVDIAPSINGKLKKLKERSDHLDLVVGNGLIRIDRQRGLYDNPKLMEYSK
ncbi:hypothetical protein FRACYDRAFT_232320 [Fragilariopsis cylindrus CCMP1102]|uniref:Calcineurin-like phosphoesterase domain-containing protein n=1 Tax=Fragilariopsis cylindrus CCMP1102 TaxID=635003 RepID=A0A1E7FVL4_9STRA|nr:hypothetical protein FRACYDRAFT_232320 [Fragilariopsis cylindrus CCMP1102]|eukprot:OEU22167.1 hypothetical protein FRACYDRAFT_232320 [Fragilariopsis cylindrus CCMP1102]